MRRRENPNGYWFWAKRHGYGWDVPASWQGWLLMVSVGLSMLLLALIPVRLLWVGGLLIAVSTGATVWGAVRHGEPARWRWGKN